jgi:adenosylcobinamide-GDP ribazoletransferase
MSSAECAQAADPSWAYPLVGAIVGLIGGGAFWGLIQLGATNFVAAAIAIALQILVTGALHEDGLADAADGLGGGRDKASALEIMKDSRIGAFGVNALLFVGIARWAALASFTATAGLVALVASAIVSRSVLPMIMRHIPYARDQGLSVTVGRPSRWSAWFAIATGAAATIAASLVLHGAALFSFIFAALAALWIVRLALVKIGGQTGDILGAVQQVAEVAALIAFSLQF